jgi:D-alanyl-D-alanine carboxypeptidase
LLAIAFSHPPLFPPGSAFDYSNTNTVLLGVVVEKVSGQSLKSFIEQNILKPEGLAHTVFPAGGEFPSPHSQGYFRLPDGKIVDATDWNPSWGWAAGNMISTLDDLRVWTRDLAIGKLISPAMKQEQQQFLPAPGEGEGALYGLQWKIRTAGSATTATSSPRSSATIEEIGAAAATPQAPSVQAP